MAAILEFRIKNLELRIKVFLSFILIALFFILAPVTFAQTSTQSAITVPATVAPTSPIYTDLLVHNLFHTFSCLSVGSSIISQPCLTYQITQDAQGAIQGIPVLSSANLSGGLLGTTTGLIAGLYMNPPVRTVDYLASVGEGLGIVKEAKAQVVGSGAQVLNPIIKLWQVSRNISYVVMIIIFVIIGLMVMFRTRINPQTVITAQAALPGLVIGLILITFSYFFAALLTDTAFIGTNVLGYYFSAAQQAPVTKPLVEATSGESVLSIMSRFLNAFEKGQFSAAVEAILKALEGGPAEGFIKGAAALMAYQYGSFVGPAVGAVVAGGTCLAIPSVTFPGLGTVAGVVAAPICAALGQAFGSVITGAGAAASVTAAPGPVIGLALWAIFVAIIIYSMFRLLLRLISNFLSIIFLVLTAPFHFLAASLPGRQGITTSWILNMLCNVLAFPAVMAVFYFIAYLLGVGTSAGLPFNVIGSPTIAGDKTFPLLGGLDLSFIRLLLAFGALVATPAIPDIICRTIGRVGVAGQLIGQEISGGTRAGQQQFAETQTRFGGIGRDIKYGITEWRGPRAPGIGERIVGLQPKGTGVTKK